LYSSAEGVPISRPDSDEFFLPDIPIIDAVAAPSNAEVVTLSGLLENGSPCSLVAVVSAYCAVCQDMRYTWPARFREWRSNGEADVKPIWLGADGPGTLGGFVEGFDTEGVVLAESALSGRETSEALWILGTPTHYLVSSDGKVLNTILGDLFPPSSLLREKGCSAG
jgi:hypothetical protein